MSSTFTIQLAMFQPVRSVQYNHYDRQWDCRFNVQQESDLNVICDAIRADYESGRLAYILIGGVEIGTRPNQDDYQIKHIHVAAIFHNRVTKSSILKNWAIKEGNGYYLVPRNRDLPYSGWRNHHIKSFSKVNQEQLSIYEMGTLPEDLKRTPIAKSEEEKKRKIDEVLIDMRGMIENKQEDEAFKKYPRTYLQYGEKLKALVTQKRDFFKNNGDPHIWLYGYAGTGKTAVLAMVYPNYYKKNLYNKFFDLYNPEVHTHVLLEDLDHDGVERLSVNFLKTICDEVGFPIDQKYKTPQLARTTVLVTSNFDINQIIPADTGVEETKAALHRRFWHLNVWSILRVLGIKLIPKDQRQQLKRDGNNDPSKVFMTWDYAQDIPTGLPLKTPQDYQEMIRNAYYSQ